MVLGAVEIGLALLGLILTMYFYLTSNHNHWKSRGIKGPTPVPIYGTVKDIIFNKYSVSDYLDKLYKNWRREPLVGFYMNRQPCLIVQDLDLVKDVLIKDFSKFVDRGNPYNDKIEPLSAHLFNIDAKRWRPLRIKLTPVFTSGKLKEMFYLLVECAEEFEKYLEEKVNDPKGVEMEFAEVAAKFATDVIGVCAFGLKMNAIASEDCLFQKMGRRVFGLGWKGMMNVRLRNMAPAIFNIVGSFLVDREMENFFINTTNQTMEYRKKNGVVKHDFVDLLMAIRDNPDIISEIELTDALLAAQLLVFFVAGYDTSSSTISNALYELARNHEVQDKLRAEIKEEMKRSGGVMEYEGIKNLKYLDMVFQETLRMYPPVTVLTRRSTEPYTFKTQSKSNLLSIDKGQRIWIPITSIQRDPAYFPNPDVFDPERFTPEAVKSRIPMTYLPFGDGPRNCIGKRFGVMQTKVGLVKILHHYKVDICEKTQIPYLSNPKTFLLSAKNGIHLKIVKDTSYITDQ